VVHSLRAQLLAWVLVPLAGAIAVDAWIIHRNASETASVVQDRLLLGSARIIAEQLRYEEGAFQEHIPPSALELFQSGQDDRIYYRVTTESGQLLSGYGELPIPPVAIQPELPYFFDTSVRSLPVRVVAFLQPVVGDSGAQPVLVEIAQTLRGHDRLTRSLWTQAVGQQLLIVVLAAVLILFGLRRGMQPLLSLRNAVLSREPGTLQPLQIRPIPVELAPLVGAINEYVKRLDHYAGAQRLFIQDAAHQLRTPFTLLNTQVSYAVRATDPAGKAESLVAIRETVQQAVRLVNQLLTLSSAEAHVADDEVAGSAVRLDTIVQQVLENLSAQAQAKNIDLGFEMTGTAPLIEGHPVAVREIVMNLVDNAIQYTQPDGVVTTRIAVGPDRVELTVEDNGPGVPESQRERVFERFYRLQDRDSRGCGLGLPIVREFASRIGATVSLQTAASGTGLAAMVLFVRAGSQPAGAGISLSERG
jgi:two-component system sensor histidine kinase TctE